jgi:hypothetical protein
MCAGARVCAARQAVSWSGRQLGSSCVNRHSSPPSSRWSHSSASALNVFVCSPAAIFRCTDGSVPARIRSRASSRWSRADLRDRRHLGTLIASVHPRDTHALSMRASPGQKQHHSRLMGLRLTDQTHTAQSPYPRSLRPYVCSRRSHRSRTSTSRSCHPHHTRRQPFRHQS